MGTRLSTAARNAMTDACVDLIDVGTVGTIKIYTSTQPATPNTAITSEVLLATVTLPDPAFSASSAGTATLLGVPLSTTGLAAGTAGWFRVLDSSSNPVFDGTCSTVAAGTGQLQLNTTTISVGVDVQVTSGSFSMPTGS